jgi:hypothetical protein
VVEASDPFDFTALLPAPWAVRTYAPAALGFLDT